MKEQHNSTKTDRQRKFLLVLPLLVLPFLTLLFWSLGGGTVNEANARNKDKGLNKELPDANFGKEKPSDKMTYYEDAASDSVKLKELMENDPYYNDAGSYLSGIDDSSNPAFETTGTYSSGMGNRNYKDPNEAKIYQKLEQLNAAMNQAPEETDSYAIPGSKARGQNQENFGKLEQMMQVMNNSGQPDPELQQINGLMESILDMQHPERVQEKLRKNSELKKGQAFAISKGKAKDPITTLESRPGIIPVNGFYSFDTPLIQGDTQNAISAVIHEDQAVVNGSTVKLRLTDDIFVNGVLIPANTFIFGLASLNGERLAITIEGIRYGNSLYPVALAVYDLDGLDGIYIPGAISRDVSKSSADRTIQNLGIATMDQSIAAQAAGAGIETAKSLLSKKVKLVKVMVKAGYQVLLKDEKQKQEN